MIRLKKFTSLISLALLLCGPVTSQNLFDSDHSKSYANYLFQSHQYKLATIELERVVFLNPDNFKAKEELIISYRKSGNYIEGIQRIQDWYPNNNPDSTLSAEWVKLMLRQGTYPDIRSYLSSENKLTSEQKNYYQLATSMLEGDWENAQKLNQNRGYLPSAAENSLIKLYNEQQTIKYKKPGVALGLSAIVPGLGKVYSKDWKDGLITLLFVATNGWQAYRGFSKDGVSSVYGWIFASMTIGFYGSNLYGSWKSARDYNIHLNHELHHEIEESIYSRF